MSATSGEPLVIRSLEFIGGMASVAGWRPESSLPEIAFAGRSNVGKSSLLNRLIHRKKMARVSNTPGRTREVNFFRVNDAFILVDLPGYGYARVSKEKRAEWRPMIESFMRSIRLKRGRLPLACCDQSTILSDLSDDYFWNVVRRQIRFRETIERLEKDGARRYIDLGPSGTLATFLKYVAPATTRSTAHAILTPYGSDRKNLAALLAAIGR